MAEVVSLSAQPRDRVGKGAARAVRRAGKVPAVIYGGKEAPLPVSIEPQALMRQLNTGAFFTTMIELDIGGKAHKVLARDVQFHPVTDRPEHVDFLRVAADTLITVAVPVIFENEATCPGIKRGGVLNIVRHEVELECRADSIPHALHADLSSLQIGDSLHISHITLPPGVTPTITDRDFTVATVAAPTVVRDEALQAAQAAQTAQTATAEAAAAPAEGAAKEPEKK